MQLEWIKTELRLLSYEFLELFEYLEQINSNEQATRMDQNGVTIIELWISGVIWVPRTD
jgi:hypothetical protein